MTTDTQFGTADHEALEAWFEEARHPELAEGEPSAADLDVDHDVCAPPGWYPDPPRLRYWTGRRWSSETQPAGPPTVTPLHGRHLKASWPPAQEPVASTVTIGVAPDDFTLADVLIQSEEEPTAPVAVVEPEVLVEGESSTHENGLWREMLVLLLIVVAALAAGAVVAAIGIALTV
ncbi:MAG TPA: DUF2510 domain-containing protein [Acidimicrobiales bacterium]|nr:DUF2510 domain-containing protein [Acidimicrobiales bacterium]